MKSLYLTESEKQHILNLHKSRMLSEQAPATPATGAPATATPATGALATGTQTQATNYTVQQLQQLLISKGYNVGAADNQLGKGTLAQIEAAVKAARGGTPATTAAPQVAPATISMDTKKATGLQTGQSGNVTGVTTATVPGTPAATGGTPSKEEPLFPS
jgi:hypothetical protein